MLKYLCPYFLQKVSSAQPPRNTAQAMPQPERTFDFFFLGGPNLADFPKMSGDGSKKVQNFMIWDPNCEILDPNSGGRPPGNSDPAAA